VKLKLKLIYNRQSVSQSVLVSGAHLRPETNLIFFLEISFGLLRVCYFVAPSLAWGRVCILLYNCFWALTEQSHLCRSPAELTAIFYCLIWDSPNLEGRTGFPFCRLLRLAELRWRYSNPPSHGPLCEEFTEKPTSALSLWVNIL
jgi:hypothetical protein